MKGFTLIEVVVSIAIGLLATSFILANYNSYNDTQSLKQAGLTLKNNLRFAQTKSSSGVKPSTPCTQLNGYSVTFLTSSYAIQASCNPEGVTGTILTVTLPPNVSFITLPNPSTFSFNVLSRGTSLDSPLTIVMTGYGRNYTLIVSPGGDISEQ